MGVSAVVNGKKYYAGNEKMMKKLALISRKQNCGTAIYLCNEELNFWEISFLPDGNKIRKTM